ncbi:septum site-determining protein Ssd [Gordonia shandongensis]|uniref:septum site-determining protein Ssd n=1 Tax=Gordonia shandongensis TaxID=376351 RepID=UPI0004112C65|nr:septum site-determining protein Ssd [Gordonia shandongensis]
MSDVLLVMAAPELHDDLARCSAAAGYAIVVGDPRRCRHQWMRATAVAADAHALDTVASAGLPRRAGLFAVAGSDDVGTLWRTGLTLGADGGFVLPDEDAALVAALSRLREPRRHPAGAVAVIPGHGGAGASTLAGAVALVAARSARVLLLDVDAAGAGADLLLGVESQPGLRWPDVNGETGAIGGAALREAVPRTRGVGVLTGARDDSVPLRPDTVLAVLDAGRGAGDVIVADVGREPGSVTTGVIDSVDLAVVVTAATVPAVAATRRTVARLLGHRESMLVVRGPSPGGLRAEQIAEAVGVPLLAGMRPEPGMAARCESRGLVLRRFGPLVRAAERVAGRVAAATVAETR